MLQTAASKDSNCQLVLLKEAFQKIPCSLRAHSLSHGKCMSQCGLDWLKTVRLGQRLIGPFGWSHVTRSFEGITASWTHAPLNFTLLVAHPTQGGFDLAAMKEIDEIDLLYAAANLAKRSLRWRTAYE